MRTRPAGDELNDLALDASIRAAALHSDGNHGTPVIRIRRQDLMRKVRIRKTSNLLIFLVDLSWSMAVTQRMRATKSAILSILTDAYQNRDRVALITFHGDASEVVIPPTRSVMLAERQMKNVPIGGKTPLAAGLLSAYELMSRERRLNADTNQLLIVLSDGDGNVPLYGGDPKEEAKRIAETIAAEGFHSLVINTEHITFDQGYANQLAKQLNAPCHLVANIRPDSLLNLVQAEKTR